jgi:hypothetical protein
MLHTPENERPDLSERALAFLALATGIAFTYWGARALVSYSAGGRDDASDPWIGLIGLLTGPLMIRVGLRLARGPRHRSTLFTTTELFWYSVVALIGGIWMFSFAPFPKGLLFPGAGVAGLILWWVRRRRAGTPTPPAA